MPAYPSEAQTRSRRFGLCDPAGCDVSDAATFEHESGVDHVFVSTENGCADCVNIDHGTADQGKNQVEIVNHQVEYRADVGAASRVWAMTLGFDECRAYRPFG